jgi:hypothetical protein
VHSDQDIDSTQTRQPITGTFQFFISPLGSIEKASS